MKTLIFALLQTEAPLVTIRFHLRAVLTRGRWCRVEGGLGWAPQLYFNTSQPGPRPGAISWNTFHGSRCYVCPEIFKHEVVHCCVFQAYELFYISKNISCVRS